MIKLLSVENWLINTRVQQFNDAVRDFVQYLKIQTLAYTNYYLHIAMILICVEVQII